MNDEEIEKIWEIIVYYYNQYLADKGVKLPALKDIRGYTKNALVLIRLAKISKAQKQAAKAAAAEAKAAAQAAQGADEFVKTGMKSPKFKKWAVRIAAALGAAGAITAGAILSKPRTYDAPLEARMRAYAEYRDYTERAAESFAFDYYDYAFRNATMMEVQAEGDQRKLDRRAFSDILKDHGYEEALDRIENSYKYDEKACSFIP